MRPKLLLNDVHLGVTRQSGTTPTTQRQLQESLTAAFKDEITKHLNKDLLILGDLFDEFLVEARIVLQAYYILADWLHESDGTLYLVPGNHDWSPKADRVSSFHFLARCLAHAYPGRVIIVNDPTLLEPEAGGLYVIPHMPNQDLFEQALEQARQTGGAALLLHCNVMSPFATHHDHALDVNEEWLKKLAGAFDRILFAHEHQHRQFVVTEGQVRTPARGERAQVFALGNQWPSSVADCLSMEDRQADGIKYAYVLSMEGERTSLARFPVWFAETDFLRIDWRDLGTVQDGPRFIRVEGSALASEAVDVVNTIAAFRQVSPALVITNAVKVAGQEGLAQAARITFDNVKSFNVMDALLAMLTEREQATIKEVLK